MKTCPCGVELQFNSPPEVRYIEIEIERRIREQEIRK